MCRKKHKGKLFKRVKMGLGLVSGALLGLLYAPKKGSDTREYLKSEEFKGRLQEAGNRVHSLREYLKGKVQRLRKRFGM